MGSLLYIVIIAVQITNSFAKEAIPLKCFFRYHKALSDNTFNNSPRFGILKFDTHSINKDEWVHDMKNIEVHGMDEAILDGYSFEFETNIFEITFHTDLVVTCNYNTSGFLFSRAIEGQGFVNSTFKNIQMGLRIPFHFIDINGKTYKELKSFDMWYIVRDKIDFNFSNFKNEDKNSTSSIHSLINKNWEYIAANFGKEFLDKIGDLIFQVFAKYMMSQPLDFSKC